KTSMKSLYRLAFLFSLMVFFNSLHAQRILISEPDKDDSRRMNFEIIGKMGSNFLIYKSIRGDNFICLYDNEMKLIKKVKHEYLPDERMINVDFFLYPDFIYAIYQYQKRNVVHCAAVKLDGMGQKISDPVELDTASIGGSANNKIYTTLSSEDKQKIIIFKINSKNREKFIITTKLFNDKLELQKRTLLTMPMDDRNDHLGEFALDNEGNLVFSKFYRTSNESISKAFMIIKKARLDSFTYYPLTLEKAYLDELRITVDNTNQRYLLSAFYYSQKRGNIEGLYFLALNRNSWQPELEKSFVFTEDLRQEARGESNMKMAFNDYFIRNIIIKRDGGFLIDAESYYTTSRSYAWNRWDYIYGSPFSYPYDYYYYSPYYSSWWWRRSGSGNQAVRYHADNVAIFSFNNKGELEWSNVIRKDQFDDESDDRISYNVMNTGGQLHFLFNMQEKKNLLLNDFSLSPDGQVNRNPMLKGLDKGHEFMPKYGKQISARQFIVPCFYRNYICFAKIDFN
ncbi:MAG TPA: hypothetical protein VFT15_04410, partial [Chitinophagaceae bacterium]|nr:hypothetical protein [Chitinophagaceae bacterium]